MQKYHFLVLIKSKNTESAQLCLKMTYSGSIPVLPSNDNLKPLQRESFPYYF